MRILGIDGALRNFGFAVGNYTNGELKIVKVEHVAFKKPSGRINKSVADVNHMTHLAKKIKEHSRGVDLVIAEISGGSQSASAAYSLGAAMGLISSIGKPIVWVTATEAKKITGNPKATKKEVINYIYKKYPDIGWKFYRGKVAATQEHIADAIAIMLAGIKRENL